MSFESLQVYDQNSIRDHENYLAKYNIQILQNNKQQLSFKEYLENLENQEQKDDFTFMDAALQEIGYKSIRFAGRGSFGTTIIGEDQNQNRFAFKLIFIRTKHGQINQDIRGKALKEANLMSQMDHPNVVKFYKYYETQNYFIIQMEECKGDLNQFMKSYELLSIESFIKYGQEISEGIQYVHDQGLVLRDLKQDNILIDQMNVAKIADFGLAAYVEQGSSRVKYSVQGAQLFRAPELQDELCQNLIQQLKKENPSLVLQSKKSDCFSLGLIFYSCLGTPLSKFIKILQDGPASIDTPVMIEGQQEFQCIDQMLQLLCEHHPNKRMKISDVIQQFKSLQKIYLPNLNRYPIPIKIQRISNQKIIILNESNRCNNYLKDNEGFEENEEQKNQVIYQKVSLQEQIKNAYIIDQNTGMYLQNQKQQYQEKSEQIDIKGASILSTSLQKCINLTNLTIDLTDNKIGDEGTRALGLALVACVKLQNLTLYLRDNFICDTGASALGSGLTNLKHITTLKLYLLNNQIGEKGIEALGFGLASCQYLSILTLYLRNNQIGDKGAIALSSSLKTCTHLSNFELYLKSNEIGDEGALALCSALSAFGNNLLILNFFLKQDYFIIFSNLLRDIKKQVKYLFA
ncbi:tyrosine kinase domain protein (macronuclear) [Tetrahymena thermophila SB210]|uniref:Tyrosine kinase domain protein n=1 Tax=Tetrahymena thermophila (strain SB210) TaxID=312017 RepID=Q24CK7_TETTS|nr:tyrosine kinase domain protein [Tetrahymena thermophila SB210]EAS05522.2 tyrosine kinase domain protein [Tetrahymena thermophila SB210]|eukprot:XP_001025767.2 tyrosine kinase domain protein [Tetrahymena thermophila SB210]